MRKEINIAEPMAAENSTQRVKEASLNHVDSVGRDCHSK